MVGPHEDGAVVLEERGAEREGQPGEVLGLSGVAGRRVREEGVWPTRITKYGVNGGTALLADHGSRQDTAVACRACRWTTARVAGSRR